MIHKIFVVLDENCHWLKLMYLFLRHVVYYEVPFLQLLRKGYFVSSQSKLYSRQVYIHTLCLPVLGLRRSTRPVVRHFLTTYTGLL
jgi:hypothetical protein